MHLGDDLVHLLGYLPPHPLQTVRWLQQHFLDYLKHNKKFYITGDKNYYFYEPFQTWYFFVNVLFIFNSCPPWCAPLDGHPNLPHIVGSIVETPPVLASIFAIVSPGVFHLMAIPPSLSTSTTPGPLLKHHQLVSSYFVSLGVFHLTAIPTSCRSSKPCRKSSLRCHPHGKFVCISPLHIPALFFK